MVLYIISQAHSWLWATVPSTLISQQQPKWQEQVINTHDLAIPLPPRKEFFRLILMSSEDIQKPESYMDRIERLYNQTGGQHVGIVFLVQDGTSKENGTRNLMTLQISLLTTYDIPIIPLFSVASLQDALFGFQRQLIASRRSVSAPVIDPLTTLLPYCSVNTPIPEHARNVLSDICHSIADVAQAATTQDGRDTLKKWLQGPSSSIVEDIIGFWEQEYIVD
ncbi:hypothetical protein B0O99DRAFT_697677 [Bisporella sp. PMI_857]|nr:hypothetical protein B0O99DRAFT_697677 [Bisporella sp. PMI_857]